MAAALWLVFVGVFVIHCEAAVVKHHRTYTGHVASSACRPCDTRNCPLVSAELCVGQVVKDRCGCCPVCGSLQQGVTPSIGHTDNRPNYSANSGCDKVKCPRNKMCLLNIQGIPMCRCPSAYICRRQTVGGSRKERDLCGRDGKTYRSRCLLQVAECTTGRKIRVAHKGRCIAGRKEKNNRRSHSKSQPPSLPTSPSKQVGHKVINKASSSQGQQGHRGTGSHTADSSPNKVYHEKSRGEGRRQKHHKLKESKKQRRKERIKQRIKRRYRIYGKGFP